MWLLFTCINKLHIKAKYSFTAQFYSDNEEDTSAQSQCMFIHLRSVHLLPFKEQFKEWIIKVEKLSA